ncbi:MAG: endonuclease [Weeksellaceae bacterium]|nr:endonuclease [Weeksellaceae bacterium]
MKKNLFSIIIIALSHFGLAQAPSGYYNSATGTGFTLKTQLYNIIKDHNTKSYGQLWGLYTGYPNAFNDNWYDASDADKIMDIYSENPNGPDPYTYIPGTNQCGNYSTEGNCYNREHLIPQSVFGERSPMVSDPFHIWPTDGKVNGERGSYPFGVVGNNVDFRSRNGSKRGNNLNSGYSAGYSGIVFEPLDEFKGDIARAYFYFATRYQENNIQSWNYAMFGGTKDKVFKDTFLKILMTWHINDPVSPREIALNNAIFTYQDNRNPFIDNPEYAQQIWGYNLGSTDFEYQERYDIDVFKKNNNTYTVTSKQDDGKIKEIYIYNLNGQLIQKIENVSNKKSIDITNLKKGVYIIKVMGNSFEINKKIVI